MRYFRSSAAIYESIRASLDAAWGYPSEATKTVTAIPPAAELPRDDAGRVYLAVSAAYCDYILPSQMLADLLAKGMVEELTIEEFQSVLPPPSFPGEEPVS